MPHPSVVKAVGAGLAALVLVAHLWMLDAAGMHAFMQASSEAGATTTVSAPHAPHARSGCPTGMSACWVPMPADPLAALLVPALIGVLFVGAVLVNDRFARASAHVATERGPPPRPAVPSSVVLLV